MPHLQSTPNFESRAAAIRYYAEYGNDAETVDEKISEGLICISAPPAKVGATLTIREGQYHYVLPE